MIYTNGSLEAVSSDLIPSWERTWLIVLGDMGPDPRSTVNYAAIPVRMESCARNECSALKFIFQTEHVSSLKDLKFKF